MELKEYLLIIKKNIMLFIAMVVLIILAAFAYFTFRPVSYSTSLTLNITRQGSQKTDQFKYDDFYRLQADEKFAETIVEWLKSPRVEADILKEAEIDTKSMSLKTLSKTIRAEKLSSQAIGVSFVAPDPKTASRISGAVVKIIAQNTESLNNNQQEETWFQVIPQEPITIYSRPDDLMIFLASLAGGIFIGFWAVMLKHYLK